MPLKVLLKNGLLHYGDLKDCSYYYRENKKKFAQLVPDHDVRSNRRVRLNTWLLKYRSLMYKSTSLPIDCLVISDNEDLLPKKLEEAEMNVVSISLCEEKYDIL